MHTLKEKRNSIYYLIAEREFLRVFESKNGICSCSLRLLVSIHDSKTHQDFLALHFNTLWGYINKMVQHCLES